MQKAIEETGMTPEEIDKAMLVGSAVFGGLGINGIFGNPIGKVYGKVKDGLSGKNTKSNQQSMNGTNSNSGYHQGSKSEQSFNNQRHGNAPSENIKNYTEEYGQSKEAFEKESRNLENLQHQRDAAVAKGRDTTILDNKIEESSMRMNAHRENMELADRDTRAEKYIQGKVMNENFSDKQEKKNATSNR